MDGIQRHVHLKLTARGHALGAGVAVAVCGDIGVAHGASGSRGRPAGRLAQSRHCAAAVTLRPAIAAAAPGRRSHSGLSLITAFSPFFIVLSATSRPLRPSGAPSDRSNTAGSPSGDEATTLSLPLTWVGEGVLWRAGLCVPRCALHARVFAAPRQQMVPRGTQHWTPPKLRSACCGAQGEGQGAAASP